MKPLRSEVAALRKHKRVFPLMKTGSVVDQQGLDEHRSADEERSGGQ